MNLTKAPKINKESLYKAVSASSSIEGYSFIRAKNNSKAIQLLKKHGRAFTV